MRQYIYSVNKNEYKAEVSYLAFSFFMKRGKWTVVTFGDKGKDISFYDYKKDPYQ